MKRGNSISQELKNLYKDSENWSQDDKDWAREQLKQAFLPLPRAEEKGPWLM